MRYSRLCFDPEQQAPVIMSAEQRMLRLWPLLGVPLVILQQCCVYETLCTRLCEPYEGLLWQPLYWAFRDELATTLGKFPAYCLRSNAANWRLG